MALSRKLSKEKVDENLVQELILKGGTSGGEVEPQERLEPEPEEEKIMSVQLRISESKVEEIDKYVKKRPGKVSRHTWIMEAIEEKLRRESE